MSTSRRSPYSDAMVKKCVIMPNPQPFDSICTRRDEDIAPYETDSFGHIGKPQFATYQQVGNQKGTANGCPFLIELRVCLSVSDSVDGAFSGDSHYREEAG